MRRSVIALIAAREVRDLLRDRRTLLIVLGLPALLYPAFVVVGLAFAVTLLEQKAIIGVAGAEYLPSDRQPGALVVRLLPSADDAPLRAREVDAMVVIPPDLMSGIDRGPRPE